MLMIFCHLWQCQPPTVSCNVGFIDYDGTTELTSLLAEFRNPITPHERFEALSMEVQCTY